MKTRRLKKAAAFLLSLVMVLSAAVVSLPGKVSAAEGVTFTLNADKHELQRGDEVTVTLEMAGNTEAFGIEYHVEYDSSKLELLSYELGEVPSSLSGFSDINSPRAGEVICGFLNTNKPYPDGTVMQMKFKVTDNAAAGNMGFTLTPVITNREGELLETNDIDATNMKVVIPATGISLKDATTIRKGSSEKLEAVLTPADSNSTVTWTSSEPSVASVSDDGTVTANAVGSAKITATANRHSAICTVTVDNPLQNITITGTASTIKKGTTTQLKLTYEPDDTTDSKKAVWSSDAPEIASVDQTGLVTANADGETTITAKVGDKTATYKITVKEVKLNSISIKPSTTIHRGEEETLEVTFDPVDTTDSKNVIWSVSDNSADPVIKVDGNGKVTACRVGEADVTATVGNHTATCKVTVDAPLTAIIPNESSVSMIKNQTAKIGYTLDPEDTTDVKNVTFTSSAPEIASVGADGTVTAHKEGDATITLSGANNVTAKVDVKVKEIPIDNVVLDKVNMTVEKGDTAELTATVYPADTTDDDKTIKWESSDPSVATVSPETTASGTATVITATDKGGTATITATAWNGTTATCKVTVPIHLESISLPVEISLLRGKTTTPEVKYNPENATDEKAVTWASDNEDVATVDAATGKITGIKEGTANITATTVDQKLSATTKVTVSENHMTGDIGADITFEELKEPVLKGQSLDMNSVLNLQSLMDKNSITDDIYIDWSADDETVVMIDQNGVITGLKEGKAAITAVITATDAEGNEIGSYEVTTEVQVKEIPLKSIAFDKIITEMKVGQIEILGIICNPEDTTDVVNVEWITSDASVLSVEGGKITALKAGVAEITAKAGDKTVSCKITVNANDSSNTGDKTDSNSATDNAIKTGDNSQIGLLGILLIISAAALIIAWRKRAVK